MVRIALAELRAAFLASAMRIVERLASAAAMRIADDTPPIEPAQRVEDVALLDAEKFELVLVDLDALARRRLAIGIVDVDDEGHALESLA